MTKYYAKYLCGRQQCDPLWASMSEVSQLCDVCNAIQQYSGTTEENIVTKPCGGNSDALPQSLNAQN